jgi:hypothetical protein
VTTTSSCSDWPGDLVLHLSQADNLLKLWRTRHIVIPLSTLSSPRLESSIAISSLPPGRTHNLVLKSSRVEHTERVPTATLSAWALQVVEGIAQLMAAANTPAG